MKVKHIIITSLLLLVGCDNDSIISPLVEGVEAALVEPLGMNSTTIWYITYRSKSNKTKSLLLRIDANTGEIKFI